MRTSPSSSLDLASNDATTGCLSSVLRRLLCNNLRNSSSRDGEEERNGIGFALEPNAEQKKPPTPGIVARLMGLESMPVYPYPPPELMRRSRSTGSLEDWPVFITAQRSRCSPQIRTSLSFREVPTFLRQENEDFLLLSFTHEDEGEIFATAPKGAKPTMSCKHSEEEKSVERRDQKKESKVGRRIEENKMKRRNEPRKPHKDNVSVRNRSNVKCSTLKNQRNVNRKFSAEMRADEAVDPMKHSKRAAERSRIGKKSLVHSEQLVECSSENSSPDSVLGNPFDVDGENFNGVGSPVSGIVGDNKPKQKNPRRKLSPEIEIPRDGGPGSLAKERRKHRKADGTSSFKDSTDDQPTRSVSDVWQHVCRLAEEDVKNTDWTSREMLTSEEAREIAVQLGLEILDLLLHEAVAACSHSTGTSWKIVQ